MIKPLYKDFRIKECCENFGHNEISTRLDYSVFGIRYCQCPALFLVYPNNFSKEKIRIIEEWVNLNNIEYDCDYSQDVHNRTICPEKHVSIGIRRDVRENIDLTSTIILSVICFAEGVWENCEKIKDLPTYPKTNNLFDEDDPFIYA